MGDNGPGERRALIDPRYVTWDAFDRRAREVDRRVDRMSEEGELFRTQIGATIADLQRQIGDLRTSITRLGTVLVLVGSVMGVIGTPLVTYLLLRLH